MRPGVMNANEERRLVGGEIGQIAKQTNIITRKHEGSGLIFTLGLCIPESTNFTNGIAGWRQKSMVKSQSGGGGSVGFSAVLAGDHVDSLNQLSIGGNR